VLTKAIGRGETHASRIRYASCGVIVDVSMLTVLIMA